MNLFFCYILDMYSLYNSLYQGSVYGTFFKHEQSTRNVISVHVLHVQS